MIPWLNQQKLRNDPCDAFFNISPVFSQQVKKYPYPIVKNIIVELLYQYFFPFFFTR